MFGKSDRQLAETKYAGKESASEKAARKAEAKAAKQAKRDYTAPATPSDPSREKDPMKIVDEVYSTPASQARRSRAKRGIADVGEDFAARDAKSITRWFRS